MHQNGKERLILGLSNAAEKKINETVPLKIHIPITASVMERAADSLVGGLRRGKGNGTKENLTLGKGAEKKNFPHRLVCCKKQEEGFYASFPSEGKGEKESTRLRPFSVGNKNVGRI